MIGMLRTTRFARSLLIVFVCLLILSLVLPQLAQAIVFDQTVDDRLDQFTLGRFQRTALGSLQATAQELQDEPGAVQLAPLGLLRDWLNSPFNLPEVLSGMGTTAIGNRIYVIGGRTFENGEVLPRANVWSAAVDTSTGAPIDPGWEAEPNLPAVVASIKDGFDEPFAEVALPAVTSVTNADGSGYIYVLGGNVQQGVRDFSSFGVSIGTVGTNGRITGWQEGPQIPSPDDIVFNQRGLQDASAVSLNIDGTTYVYIIGGLQRYLEGTGGQIRTEEEGSNKVFFARVGANGQLFQPSNPSTPGWDVVEEDIPVPGNGIWGAVALANQFVASGDQEALYLTGGELSVSPFNSNSIYQATFGSDGIPIWEQNPIGTLPSSRSEHAGVEFRGNLYLTGGKQGSSNEPDRNVLTSYVEDDLGLPVFGDADGANFLPNPALPVPRLQHGSVVVATDEGTAFVYVIGGRGDTTDGDTTDDQGTSTVIYGKVGGIDSVADTTFAPNGWFYSNPYQITFDRAQVRQITWSTLITRTGGSNMDIEMDYRTSSSADCNNADWTDDSWQALDGSDDANRSQDGRNGVEIQSPEARCFQYRARLSTASEAATPSLLKVGIQIFIPGAPDLKPTELAGTYGGDDNQTLVGLDVFVLNENEVEQTLDATVEGSGDFFVDMCIFGPGETIQEPTLPIEENNPQCTKVYGQVNKNLMTAGAKRPVTKWLSIEDDRPVTPEQLTALFPEAGTYTMLVAVDSTDYVSEEPQGGEDNNIGTVEIEVFPGPEGPKVDIQVPSPTILLPIVGR